MYHIYVDTLLTRIRNSARPVVQARAAALSRTDQISAVSAFTPVPVVTPSPIGQDTPRSVVGALTRTAAYRSTSVSSVNGA
jgi:hypothetical protein